MAEPKVLDRKSINSFKQNKQRLIVADAVSEFGSEEAGAKVSEIMLRRGVNKWMGNRKKIISLNHEVRKKMPGVHVAMALAKGEKDWYRRGYCRGYLRALTEVRNEMTKICKSNRWVEKF